MALIISFPFHLFLMFILQIQGSASVHRVFVQTGKDLILNLTKAEIPQNSHVWLWQFNGKGLVTFLQTSQPLIQESYTGRIEVLEREKYNVKLKNLQKSDSGIYTAKTVVPKDKKLSEYNVTVQDPVSLVELTVTLTSNTSSGIFTVTCRAGNSSISSTLRCVNKTCGESRGVTTSGSSLHIYQLDKSIICNHRNQVSFTKSTKTIQDSCTKQGSTSVNHVFVQTGKDLILNLTEAEIPQNSMFWLWEFNGKALIKCLPPSPPTVEETYTGRIEVLEKTYNVKLKNLQKSHSGIYSARSILPEDKKLSEYNVTVQAISKATMVGIPVAVIAAAAVGIACVLFTM